jgi:type I restriction enzyme R subunit
MSQNLGGERIAVQDPLIDYANDMGWKRLTLEKALELRGGNQSCSIFKDIFVEQMLRLNDFMTEEIAEDLAKRLEMVRPNIEGNLVAWEHLKGLKQVFVPSEKRERNVTFIDTENLDNNTFHVTDEFWFTGGTKPIRQDVVFLINGFPVLMAETKSSKKHEGMAAALDQVARYHNQGPELMALEQIYTITHIIQFYYSGTWNTSAKWLFDWKEETAGNFETLVKSFFDRERVVKLLTDFILFTRQDDDLKKVIMRPHQMKAVDKIIQRSLDPDKKRALIWHTQGSGKTFTMIVAAQKIIQDPRFHDPTVIMLVDRNELETQLFGNIEAMGIERVEVAQSKKHLQELLSSDRRGLIVSMIHKFDYIPEKINIRQNIFVLADEAHRSTGGTLGNYLMGALPNATYLGFTGTPIDKTVYGTGTFVVFGRDDPPQGYLDKYSISESIRDRTTVPLHYTLAPNELRVDRETLEEEFLDLKEAQGISDISDLNKILKKAVNLKNMLKSRERVDEVARYVADHYKANVEPLGYKAFMVAVDRHACALYKEALDKYLPPEYSQVVYSAGPDDSSEMARYHLSGKDEKAVRKAFRKPDQLPKILIVTEKLLTGFDAPVLYCMYLDKPMRDHVLLQAIARVNRPYEDDDGRKKPSGFVLDFVGIFENLEKALAFDSQDIEGVISDIELLKVQFAQLMQKAKGEHLSILEGKRRDKAVEAVLDHFNDDERRHLFYAFFEGLADFYDIISPDAFLRPYIRDFETLGKMYSILKEAYEPSSPVDREFSKKTAELVQKNTTSGPIMPALEVYEINEDTLRLIDESNVSETEKVYNLGKSIYTKVEAGAGDSPYLISIGEKAEAVVQRFRERQAKTSDTLEKQLISQDAINELKRIISEMVAAMKEQVESGMSPDVFSIFWQLKEEGMDDPKSNAALMADVLDRYPYWRTSEAHEREVKQELYKVLFQSGIRDVPRVTVLVQKMIGNLKGGA